MTTRQRVLLLLIMMAAAFLRAEYLLQIEHNVDHAYPVWQALQTLDRGVFPLTGQGTSVLFANPALTGYLFLPLIALTRSPLGAYLLVIALNTVAVLLAYRTARLIVGGDWALVAALLMAVNPWVIEYSRTSWVQSLLPFGVCALTWALFPVLLGVARHPARRLLVAFTILTAVAQTYLLAFALVVPVGVLIVIFWRRVPKRALAVGAAIFLIAAAIYSAGLLAQSAAVQARLSAFGSNPAHLSTEALDHALRLVTGQDYAIARGTLAPIQDSELRQRLSRFAHVALGWTVFIGAGMALLRLLGGNWRNRAIIPLVWWGLPIAMMSYVGQVIHPFYQLLGIPAGYVLAAWGCKAVFESTVQSLRREPTARDSGFRGTAIVLILLVPFAVLMGINSARYYQDTAVTPGIDGLSALPLEAGLKLGAAIREKLPGTVYADIDEWILSSFSGATLDTVRDARAPAFNFVPAASGVYVALYKAGEPEAAPLGVDVLGRIRMVDGSVIVVDHLSQSAMTPMIQMNVSSDQGITLVGYEVDRQDDTWTLTTYWRVVERVEGIDQKLFAPFAHLFDTDGQRILIVDGQAVPGYEWREGDMHAHRLTFTVAAGTPFTISVGQYDAGNGVNAIFVLPDGEYTPLIPLAEPVG